MHLEFALTPPPPYPTYDVMRYVKPCMEKCSNKVSTYFDTTLFWGKSDWTMVPMKMMKLLYMFCLDIKYSQHLEEIREDA